MFKFGLSQKLVSLCFVAISVGFLLVLSLPAETEVNSHTLSVLDIEELSQIAGGAYCYKIGHTGGGSSGWCRPNGSLCASGSMCGSNPYTAIYSSDYCTTTPETGYHECSCRSTTPGWRMYNCRVCSLFNCSRSYLSSGGSRTVCTGSASCPSN